MKLSHEEILADLNPERLAKQRFQRDFHCVVFLRRSLQLQLPESLNLEFDKHMDTRWSQMDRQMRQIIIRRHRHRSVLDIK